MDTGDLSEEEYLAIMIEAKRFNHDLTLQFGLLSCDCKTKTILLRNEYLSFTK